MLADCFADENTVSPVINEGESLLCVHGVVVKSENMIARLIRSHEMGEQKMQSRRKNCLSNGIEFVVDLCLLLLLVIVLL